MKHIASIFAIGLLAAVSTEAQAGVPSQAVVSPTANNIPVTVKRIRVETADAKVFSLNGHRILIPADENAEAMIAILKQRFPDLKPDAGARLGVPSVD